MHIERCTASRCETFTGAPAAVTVFAFIQSSGHLPSILYKHANYMLKRSSDSMFNLVCYGISVSARVAIESPMIMS